MISQPNSTMVKAPATTTTTSDANVSFNTEGLNNEMSLRRRSKHAAHKYTHQKTSRKTMDLQVGFKWNQNTGRLHTYPK